MIHFFKNEIVKDKAVLPLQPYSFQKIGLFDSGLGGLTVLRALYNAHVAQHYVYVGDTAYLPYGGKSVDTLQERARIITQFLVSHNINVCVIACHTLSAVAYTYLQEQFPTVTFVGMIDLVAEHALKLSKNNRIGIMATTATIKSHAHRTALLKRNSMCTVVEQECPELVPLIEAPIVHKENLYEAVRAYIDFLRVRHVDTIILGSTHYALLKNMIYDIVGTTISLISAEDIIAQPLTQVQNTSVVECFVTSDSDFFAQKTAALLQWKLPTYQLHL